jgi:hypothetical protein
MRLFFDDNGGKYPNKNVQYVGRIEGANSIAGDENFIRIVVSDQNVIDFLKSWNEDNKKTIYLMYDTNSTTACVSSHIKNLQKDCGWCSIKAIEGAYEVRLMPKRIEFLGSFDKKLLKSIMLRDNRDNKINKILDDKTDV